MTIVTLTTDFGLSDYYVGMLKGTLLSKSQPLQLVDISHQITPYDIVHAAFIVKHTYQSFPKGTIHLVAVDNAYEARREYLVLQRNGHIFMGPNNGIFSLVFGQKIKEAHRLSTTTDMPSLYTVFADAVAHLAAGKPFAELGVPVKRMVERITLQPVISHSQIRGTVIHIDNYDNAMVNIPRELFERIGNKRAFDIYFKRNDPIHTISRHYSEVSVGDTLCLFNSAGYLEIAINMGKAATMLGLHLEDTVQVDFHS